MAVDSAGIEWDDPEPADAPPLAIPGPNGCPRGGLCDGCGFVWVLPGYAEELFPDPEPLTLDATPEKIDNYDIALAHVALMRKAAVKSAYPCRECMPVLYERWANGCCQPNHRRESCVRCIEDGVVPKARQRQATA